MGSSPFSRSVVGHESETAVGSWDSGVSRCMNVRWCDIMFALGV